MKKGWLLPGLFLLFFPRRASSRAGWGYTPEGLRIREKWGHLTGLAAQKHGVPEFVIVGVIGAESDGQEDVIGRDGEIGLMQLLPSGALADYEREVGHAFNPWSPVQNIDIGTWYLSKIQRMFPLDKWQDKIQAYNVGLQGYSEKKRNLAYAERVQRYIVFPESAVS